MWLRGDGRCKKSVAHRTWSADGIRMEGIEEPTIREIRYLDKLIDGLAKGKAIKKILR